MHDRISRAREMIAEMLRLAALTGNCGRVIERFLERTLEDGELEVRFELPRSWHLLDMACFVASMREDIESRRASESTRPYPAPYLHALSVFPWLSTGMVSYVVPLADEGTSVSARKQMLKGLAQTLDMAMDDQAGWLQEDGNIYLRSWYLGDDFVVTETQLTVFEEVARGLYTRLEMLPVRMMALANVLNSQVATAAPAGTDLVVVAAGAEASAAEHLAYQALAQERQGTEQRPG